MTPFIAEIVGTLILILLGNGVVANVVLQDTKGNGGGWLLINFGWGLAVFTAVVVAGPYSGAHLNPAVTLGLAIVGKFAWANVAFYILAQMIGAALGAFFVWLTYKDHYYRTEDTGLKLATFCTAPAIRKPISNVITEAIGTFVLIFGVLYLVEPKFNQDILVEPIFSPEMIAEGKKIGLGSIGALPVALIVTVIGMSLGGPTGYAINPARDLAPRIMHAVLPMGKKGDSDWEYSWVPVIGPIVGAAAAAGLFMAL